MLGLGVARAQPAPPKPTPPAPEEAALSLRPRYVAGFEREVEARLSILTTLRYTLPSAGIDRTSEQESVTSKHWTDHVREGGKRAPIRVIRRYLSSWEGLREGISIEPNRPKDRKIGMDPPDRSVIAAFRRRAD